MKRSEPLLLGVDLGTRAVRIGLFTSTGDLVSTRSESYDFVQPRPGWAEQNPLLVWKSLMAAIHTALNADIELSKRVVGISISGTAVTLVTCDSNGVPIIPALLWMDIRATDEALEISSLKSPFLNYTGGQVSPEWMLPKTLWLKRHKPNVYQQATRIAELTDWLVCLLTGEWATSLSTASAEWSYVSSLGGWPIPIFEAVGLEDLPPRLPPRVIPPGEIVGTLTEHAANLLGLRAGIPVAEGLMDSYAAALGLNVLSAGRVILSLGTSSAYIAITDRPRKDPALLGPVPDAFGPGISAQQGGQTSAGAIVEWFVKQLGCGKSYSDLDAGAALIGPGVDGLLALDCWLGSRTPYRDPYACGAFWGLHLNHTSYHLYRSLLESVAFGGRQVLDCLRRVDIQANEIWICGGGTHSWLWVKIHADVLGLPIIQAEQPNAVIVGSAICASVGTNFYPSLKSAAQSIVRPGKRVEPSPETHALYTPYYEEYCRGYAMLKESFHRLTALNANNAYLAS